MGRTTTTTSLLNPHALEWVPSRLSQQQQQQQQQRRDGQNASASQQHAPPAENGEGFNLQMGWLYAHAAHTHTLHNCSWIVLEGAAEMKDSKNDTKSGTYTILLSNSSTFK